MDKNKKKRNNELNKNIPPRRSSRVQMNTGTNSLVDSVETSDIKIEIEVKLEAMDEDDVVHESSDVALQMNEPNYDAAARTDTQDIIEEVLVEVVNHQNKPNRDKFKCDICNYVAKDNFNLRRHKTIMHTKSLLKCIICSKLFQDKFQYIQHNPLCYFSCHYAGCSKKFKILRKFEIHKRAHERYNERLY